MGANQLCNPAFPGDLSPRSRPEDDMLARYTNLEGNIWNILIAIWDVPRLNNQTSYRRPKNPTYRIEGETSLT